MHVRNLQARLTDTDKKHESAILRASHLQKSLEEETNANQTLRQQMEKLKKDIQEERRGREQLRGQEVQQQKLLQELEENCKHLEMSRMEEANGLRSSVREYETLAADHLRELQLLRKHLKQSEGKVQHLQELLVEKDEELQREKVRVKPLGNKDVQDMVASQIREEHSKMTSSREHYEARLSEQQQAYQKLEDEFRLGLGVEASRYRELEGVYLEVLGEVEASRKTALMAVQKEQRAVEMVRELTTLVKDLKTRLKELSIANHDMGSDLREKMVQLDTQVADRNRMEVQLLSVQEVMVEHRERDSVCS